MNWVAVVQQLDRDLLALEMVRSGLLLEENKIRSTPLFYLDSGGPINKSDYKELGASGIVFRQTSVEVLIGLTANSIETFSIRLKRHLGIDWEPFKNPMNQVRYAERARQFRALNNVLKHQEGYIEASSSRSATFLIAGGYFDDMTYLRHLTPERIVPNLELALYETFSHLYEICIQVSNINNHLSGKSGAELVCELRKRVVPSVIQPPCYN